MKLTIEQLAKLVKSMRVAQRRAANYPTEENRACAKDWESTVDEAWSSILEQRSKF